VKNFTNFACSAAGETLHIFADITDGRSFAGIFWAWKGLGKRKLSGAGQKMADKRRCAAMGLNGLLSPQPVHRNGGRAGSVLPFALQAVRR